MDFKDLTIFKAKSQLESLNNRRDALLELKLKAAPLPKSKELSSVNVNGGSREDKFANYVIRVEEIDEEIRYIDTMIVILENYIKKELARLDEYDEWKQKVIYMREQEHKTWIKIACSVPYSEVTCKRIYRNYKNKRCIDTK